MPFATRETCDMEPEPDPDLPDEQVEEIEAIFGAIEAAFATLVGRIWKDGDPALAAFIADLRENVDDARRLNHHAAAIATFERLLAACDADPTPPGKRLIAARSKRPRPV